MGELKSLTTTQKISKDDIHNLLKTFYADKGLVRQHLDSYNEFIDHGLQEVVDEVNEIPIEVPESPYKVKLGQIWVIAHNRPIRNRSRRNKTRNLPNGSKTKKLSILRANRAGNDSRHRRQRTRHRTRLHRQHPRHAKKQTLLPITT